MEKRIYEAAEEGNVISLLNLLQEDSLILDRVTVNCYGETPLHIASMLGHEEFVREILERKPELARELDSQKSSSLHLATAKGYVNIVKILVSVNPDMCFAVDRDGRNPLHIAAMKGHVEVLRELVQARPVAARARLDKEETVLHVSVRYYQFEAMKYLVETMKDDEFLNSIDDGGNTILHLAVAIKHVQAVKFLTASTATKVNALNANGFTALDILKQLQSKRNMKDWEIGESLQRAGAISSAAKDIDLSAHKRGDGETRTLKISHNFHNGDGDWLGKKREALMVVASLIANMAFQGGVNPPGGVWQDNSKSSNAAQAGANPPSGWPYPSAGFDYENQHQAGEPIVADQPFFIFITTSFVASLSIILLLISGLPLNRKAFMWILMIILWVAVTTLALAYLISLSTLSGYKSAPLIGLFIWFGLLALLFLVHTIRLRNRLIKYFGERRQSRTSRMVITMIVWVAATAPPQLAYLFAVSYFVYGGSNSIIGLSIYFGFVSPLLLVDAIYLTKRLINYVRKKIQSRRSSSVGDRPSLP